MVNQAAVRLPTPDDVRQLRDAGDVERALQLALRAWWETRDPVIAAVVEDLDARVQATFDAPKARTKEKFHQAWMEEAARGDEATTGWLAATLNTKAAVAADYYGILRDHYTTEKYAVVLERARALGERTPDPRVARGVCALLEKAPWSGWSVEECREIYTPMLELVVAAGDPRVAESLQALVDDPRAPKATVREMLAEELPGVIRRLRQVPVQGLDEPLGEAWSKLLGRQGNPTAERDKTALFAHIYAHPEDDGARLVLADMLQLEGDPLGEFIALQFSPSTKKGNKRMRSLLKAHKESWLGPDLTRVLKSPEFERGFLHRASLAQNAAATAQVWERAYHDERLATLGVLYKGRSNERHYAGFLTGGARNVTEVEFPRVGVLRTFMTAPGASGRLAFAHFRFRMQAADLRTMARSNRFEHLQGVSLTVPEGQLGGQLQELEATGWLDRLRSVFVAWDWNGPSLEETLGFWPGLAGRVEVYGFGDAPHGWVRLWQEEGRTIASVVDLNADVRAALPADVAAIRQHER